MFATSDCVLVLSCVHERNAGIDPHATLSDRIVQVFQELKCLRIAFDGSGDVPSVCIHCPGMSRPCDLRICPVPALLGSLPPMQASRLEMADPPHKRTERHPIGTELESCS